jgi:hypothetical protein
VFLLQEEVCHMLRDVTQSHGALSAENNELKQRIKALTTPY